MAGDGGRGTVAILIWGDLFEDYFSTIGVDLTTFRTEFTGSWLFGYVEALQRVGVDSVLLFVTGQVEVVTRVRHEPSGARVVLLPALRRHRWARRLRATVRRRTTMGYRALGSVASYLALPLLSLRRELRAAGVARILVQEYEHARFDVLVLLGRLLGLPVFATFQGGDAPFSRLEGLVRGRAVRAAAGLIVADDRERERLRETYRVEAARLANVPNPVDASRYASVERLRAREALGVPREAVVVEWHGRVVVHRKGLDVLLDAWARLCARHPDRGLLLSLLGSGTDAEQLRRLIDAQAVPQVRWRDEFVNDRDELARHLAAGDVYVLPSRHEGFAVAPLEAMAAGLPVVACDAPGVGELFADGEAAGGVVVPREDPAALAAALERLVLDIELARELGARAQQHVRSRYSLEAVGAQLGAFLLEEEAWR